MPVRLVNENPISPNPFVDQNFHDNHSFSRTGITNPSTDADLEDGIFAANGIRWSGAGALLGHINTQKVSILKLIGVMERILNKKQEMVECEAPWYPRSRRPVKAGDPRHHPQPYIVCMVQLEQTVPTRHD